MTHMHYCVPNPIKVFFIHHLIFFFITVTYGKGRKLRDIKGLPKLLLLLKGHPLFISYLEK